MPLRQNTSVHAPSVQEVQVLICQRFPECLYSMMSKIIVRAPILTKTMKSQFQVCIYHKIKAPSVYMPEIALNQKSMCPQAVQIQIQVSICPRYCSVKKKQASICYEIKSTSVRSHFGSSCICLLTAVRQVKSWDRTAMPGWGCRCGTDDNWASRSSCRGCGAAAPRKVLYPIGNAEYKPKPGAPPQPRG